MNRKSFFEEVQAEGKNTPEFEDAFYELVELQEKAKRTLLEFHRICESHNIQYQVAFGSLLGIIRDEGLIPWDSDVDVLIDVSDRERLIHALESSLSLEYYYYSPQSDRKCRHEMIRVSPKGFMSEALHVDVFYLAGLPNKEKEKVQKKYYWLARARYCKFVKVRNEWNGKYLRLIKLMGGKLAFGWIPGTYLERTFNKLTSKYSLKQSEYCTTPDLFAKENLFHTKDMLETQLVPTLLGELRIPTEYDRILKAEYGDYMAVPPLDSRIREVIGGVKTAHKYDEIAKKHDR